MKNSFENNQLFFDFIKNNAKSDPQTLLLSLNGKTPGFPPVLAVVQIECRQKAGRKLSSFVERERFIFPSVQASEQASHQCVSAYHAMLVGKDMTVADMTAGLGIDAFSIAMAGNRVTAFEIDDDRFSVLEHNKRLFDDGISRSGGSIDMVHGDSIKWLRENSKVNRYDYIFIDPARRDSDGKRTFKFADCMPDVVADYDILKSNCRNLLIKSSPILDVHQVTYELPETTSIHMVCIKGECKELLVMRESDRSNDDPVIKAIDLDDREDASLTVLSEWECRFSDLGRMGEINNPADIKPGIYIYDTNAAIHKLHVSAKLCADFPGLKKISANTDLYISEDLHEDFPGRIFRITAIPDKKTLKSYKGMAMEVVARNYPLTANQLRKKLGVKSGGEEFVFGFRAGSDEKPVTVTATKIKKQTAG